MSSAARLQAIADSQTGIAKKILAACPIADWWSLRQIMDELYREHHVRYEQHVVRGCLRSLREAGLVQEKGDLFQQVTIPVKNNVKPIKEPEVSVEDTAPEPKTKVSGENLVLHSVARLRSVSALLLEVATDLEEAVLRIEEASQERDKEVEQLRQLKALLNGLK